MPPRRSLGPLSQRRVPRRYERSPRRRRSPLLGALLPGEVLPARPSPRSSTAPSPHPLGQTDRNPSSCVLGAVIPEVGAKDAGERPGLPSSAAELGSRSTGGMLGAHRDWVPYLCGAHGGGNSLAGRARGRGQGGAAEPRGRRQPSVARSRTGDRWQYTRDDGRPSRGDGGNNNN